MMHEARFGGIPLNISVPNYPRIAALDAEIARLQKSIRAVEDEIGRFEYSAPAQNAQSFDLAAIAETGGKRASVRRKVEELYVAKSQSESRLTEMARQREDWVQQFGVLLIRKQELEREWSVAAPDGEPGTFSIGQQAPRGRSEVAEELLETAQRLAILSNDPKMMQEARQLRQQVEEILPYVTLQEPYHKLPSGEVITEAELNRRAVQSQDLVRGARCFYGRGCRVDKSDARKWGMLPKEAA